MDGVRNRLKTISILVPCFNEEENIEQMANALLELADSQLTEYACDIVFIDNNSVDATRDKLASLCQQDKRVKAIFNARNFGAVSSYYGIMQMETDCVITIPCDFQIPLSMIPQALRKWEAGSKIVAFVKGGTEEHGIKRMCRKLYYALLIKFSPIPQIPHFTGAGLYDQEFITVCRKLNDPIPSMRGNVAEFGYKVEFMPYQEVLRKRGKSKNNFFALFDLAMRNFIAYTNLVPRMSTMLGVALSALSFAVGLYYLVQKLLHWNTFVAGMTPVLIGMFFLGGIELLFLGLIGEYLMQINARIKNHPLVIEEKRINFTEHGQDEK